MCAWKGLELLKFQIAITELSRTFSANKQYFSFTPNQPTVLSAMAYQPNKPKRTGRILKKDSLE